METCPTSGGNPCSGVPHAISISASVLAAHAGVTITLKELNQAQSDHVTGLEPPQMSPRRRQGEAAGEGTHCRGTFTLMITWTRRSAHYRLLFQSVYMYIC